MYIYICVCLGICNIGYTIKNTAPARLVSFGWLLRLVLFFNFLLFKILHSYSTDVHI